MSNILAAGSIGWGDTLPDSPETPLNLLRRVTLTLASLASSHASMVAARERAESETASACEREVNLRSTLSKVRAELKAAEGKSGEGWARAQSLAAKSMASKKTQAIAGEALVAAEETISNLMRECREGKEARKRLSSELSSLKASFKAQSDALSSAEAEVKKSYCAAEEAAVEVSGIQSRAEEALRSVREGYAAREAERSAAVEQREREWREKWESEVEARVKSEAEASAVVEEVQAKYESACEGRAAAEVSLAVAVGRIHRAEEEWREMPHPEKKVFQWLSGVGPRD